MERNLILTCARPAEKAARLRGKMEEYFPEAKITSYELLVPAMHNDVKNRHVVAAAVKAGAQVFATASGP